MPSGSICGRKTKRVYCYTHEVLAEVSYDRPKGYQSAYTTHPPDVKKKSKSKKEQWKEDLDRELAALTRKGKRSFEVSKKDFPCYIDGIYFQSIQEYADYFASSPENLSAEMESVDRPYDKTIDFRDISRWSTTTQGSFNFYKEKPKPQYNLSKASWKRVDSVAHMRYCVVRDAAGDYFAVWVSLGKDAKLVEVMAEIIKAKLPQRTPVHINNYGYHTSAPCKGFNAAEGNFFRGGETLSRVKERYAKAQDPNWIPPNLRTLAVEATHNPEVWQIIPTENHAKLKAWLDGGCPGWWAKDPSHKWYKDRGLAVPSKFYRVMGPVKDQSKDLLITSKNGQIRQVWDSNLKQWIKKWFPL